MIGVERGPSATEQLLQRCSLSPYAWNQLISEPTSLDLCQIYHSIFETFFSLTFLSASILFTNTRTHLFSEAFVQSCFSFWFSTVFLPYSSNSYIMSSCFVLSFSCVFHVHPLDIIISCPWNHKMSPILQYSTGLVAFNKHSLKKPSKVWPQLIRTPVMYFQLLYNI